MSLAADINNIYSFEASEDTFAELPTNIQINNLDQLITPECIAISDKNGIVEFLTESPLSGINSIAATSIHNSNLFNNIAEIPSKKLNSLFNFSNEVLAFKIDLEGHEFHVLEGAKNLLAKNQCILQCENYSNATGDIRKLLS